MKFAVYLFLFCFSCINISCAQSQATSEKIDGVSFVAPAKPIGVTEINQPKQKVDAGYLSVMPYSFIPQGSTQLYYNSKGQWWGEREVGTIETIRLAQEAGYKVMLKPHVWKRHGEYTGLHAYETDAEWEAFERSFATYILRYAEIADSMKVELFCIGTEWEQFVLRRPNFWSQLIRDVRKVYQGKLTYAANWDEYSKVSFWKQLDFIGIDAYFPLTEEKTPKINSMKAAFIPLIDELKVFSKVKGKAILFTEYGYRSRDYAAKKPWEADWHGESNQVAQQNAYTAFYESLWNEEFVAGGFIWKWFANYSNSGGPEHNGFTPQNKPVEKIIQQWYSKSE